MNANAARLKLSNTRYANPHGLPNKSNKSSAFDVCRLARQAYRYPLIAEIVAKQIHKPTIYSSSYLPVYYYWENTNKAL